VRSNKSGPWVDDGQVKVNQKFKISGANECLSVYKSPETNVNMFLWHPMYQKLSDC